MLYKSKMTSIVMAGTIILLSACSEEMDGMEEKEPVLSEVVTILDANFESMLIEKGIDSDGIVNQEILREDMNEVATLDLSIPRTSESEKKIVDLTGIEGFKLLYNLSIENHALTSVSLNENTALVKLNLNSNQLTTLDLSENTALTYLEAGANELTEIDLSANTNLDTALLQLNYFETIDVSNNTNLVELNLHFNELTSITGLGAMTKMDRLNLSWNFLETLDISIPTLVGLNIEQNQLRSVSVEGSTSLKNFIATTNSIESLDLASNVALETLLLSANQVSTIDLSNNLKLEYLWISSNKLTELDVSALQSLHNLSIGRNTNLACVEIATDQFIATVNKEDAQELVAGGCPE